MDGAGWDSCRVKIGMLDWVRSHPPGSGGPSPSDRKLRLLVCMLSRMDWSSHPARGEPPDGYSIELVRAESCAETGDPLPPGNHYWVANPDTLEALRQGSNCYFGGEDTNPSDLFREVLGNPLSPVSLGESFKLSPITVSLAREMYESRDFTLIGVLGDSLQDDGCEEESVLRHCRGFLPCHHCGGRGVKEVKTRRRRNSGERPCPACQGSGWLPRTVSLPHARGCWVTDLVLGKS